METLRDAHTTEIFATTREASPPLAWYPTKSQAAVLWRLNEVADVFDKTGDSRLVGLHPGCRRVLLIGTSGVGKTAGASRFTAELIAQIHPTSIA